MRTCFYTIVLVLSWCGCCSGQLYLANENGEITFLPEESITGMSDKAFRDFLVEKLRVCNNLILEKVAVNQSLQSILSIDKNQVEKIRAYFEEYAEVQEEFKRKGELIQTAHESKELLLEMKPVFREVINRYHSGCKNSLTASQLKDIEKLSEKLVGFHVFQEVNDGESTEFEIVLRLRRQLGMSDDEFSKLELSVNQAQEMFEREVSNAKAQAVKEIAELLPLEKRVVFERLLNGFEAKKDYSFLFDLTK